MATTGLTALQGIDALGLRRGHTVLIFGASGAVGTMAVQFARQRGAHVIATASGAAPTRLVRSLGAHRVIDGRRTESTDRLRTFAPKLSRHLGSARIRVPIAATCPLGKAAQAHRRLDREHVLGRMVLQVNRDRH